jgi:hypothetical protein
MVLRLRSIWTEVLAPSFDKLRTSSVVSRGVGAQPRVSERSEDPGCLPDPNLVR